MALDANTTTDPPTPEEQAHAVGDYYEGHPEPPEEPVTADAQAAYDEQMATWEAKFGEEGPPEPPEPPTIPGPPSPGAGMPAARLGDLTAHGGTVGPVVTGTTAGVMINFMPAACMGDMHVCPMFDGPKPHVGGMITQGSTSVMIGFMPAASVSNVTECKGPPGAIALGETSVMIGDIPPPVAPPAAPSARAEAARTAIQAAAAPAETEAATEAKAQAAGAALTQAAANGASRIEIGPKSAGLVDAVARRTYMVAFQVVFDATGEPVPGVELKITLPDGKIQTQITDGNGQVLIEDLEAPGVCSVTCELKGARPSATFDFVLTGKTPTESAGPGPGRSPLSPSEVARRIIAEVEEHKVKKGESIKSLAEANGMTWQELAIFNWGTAVPTEINEHLRDDVGCTQKTRDGYNYMFDNSDDPGIIYIPRRWSLSGLATEQVHTIRVSPIRAGVTLLFALRSKTTGHLLPFYDYSVYDEGGRLITRGKTDENGDGRAKVDRAGEYEVIPGTLREYEVSGQVHLLKDAEPLSDADVEVRPWQAEHYTVKTGPKGELNLTKVPYGELILCNEGAEYSVFVEGNISGGFFFIPRHEPGPPFEEGDQELNV